MNRQTWVNALAVIFIFTAFASAQPATRPGFPTDRPMPLLDRARSAIEDLNLSDDQKTKVKDIFDKAREKAETMRQDLMAMDPPERRQRIEEFAKGVRDQLAKVLTDDQRTAMDKKLEEARQNMRNRFGPATGPSTRPDFNRPGGQAGRPGEMLDRLRDNLAKLDLSDEQKTKVKSLLEEAKTKFQSLREQAQNGSQDAREKFRDLFQQTREKLNDILSPEQQEKLHSMMGRDGPPAPSSRSAKADSNDPSMAGDMKDADMASSDKKNARERSGDRARRGGRDQGVPAVTSAGDASSADAKKSPQVGEPAPPFALKKTDGALTQLASMKGRVIVLEFGSYSCPAFRDRAAAMEKLRNDYGTRATFFVVYGREAHAKGEWEVARNKDNDISIDQPKTADSRLELAKKAKQELKMTTPILVDTIGNDTSIAYGAGANSAYVINRDGTIAARQDWFDPTGLRREIDDATKTGPTTKSALPAAAE